MSHSVGPKEGSSWSPINFSNGQRSSSNAQSSSVVVLDCDKGDDPQEIVRKCIENNIAALIVSTHSNGKTQSSFSQAEYAAV